MQKFINFVEKFREYDSSLVESIIKGFKVLHENEDEENQNTISITLPDDPNQVEEMKSNLSSELDKYKNASTQSMAADAVQQQAKEELKKKSEELSQKYTNE